MEDFEQTNAASLGDMAGADDVKTATLEIAANHQKTTKGVVAVEQTEVRLTSSESN